VSDPTKAMQELTALRQQYMDAVYKARDLWEQWVVTTGDAADLRDKLDMDTALLWNQLTPSEQTSLRRDAPREGYVPCPEPLNTDTLRPEGTIEVTQDWWDAVLLACREYTKAQQTERDFARQVWDRFLQLRDGIVAPMRKVYLRLYAQVAMSLPPDRQKTLCGEINAIQAGVTGPLKV